MYPDATKNLMNRKKLAFASLIVLAVEACGRV